MAKFTRKFLIFLLPFLVILVVLEITLRHIPNDYAYKNQYLNKNAENIQTLILGHSETYRGIDPQFFGPHAFNAAYSAQTLDYDLLIFNKYKNRFKNLKTIIIPIAYFSLYARAANTLNTPNSTRIKNYVIYYGIYNNASLKDFTELTSGRVKLKFFGLYKYLFKNETNRFCDSLGWGYKTDVANQNQLKRSGIEAANAHLFNDLADSGERLKANTDILRAFIKECQLQNISIVFVTPPTFKSYRLHLNALQRNLMRKVMKKITDTYSNCYYYDFSASAQFSAKDFRNADHLNKTGAIKFSKLLSIKIKALRPQFSSLQD